MSGHLGRGRAFARRHWRSIGAAVVLAAALLAERQPWRAADPPSPRPVALVPTATRPAPTATRAPERFALPPATPASPTVAAARPASPPRATPSTARADGTILYLGALDGREGIVVARADGSERRLIASGQYDTLAWEPGGSRFAAAGPLQAGATSQVAIFYHDGTALGRYAFEGTIGPQLLWSRDGSKLAVAVQPLNASRQPALRTPTEVWQIAMWGEVARVVVPEARSTLPFAWGPTGNLYVVTQGADDTRTLWQASGDGGYTVREYSGKVIPLSLSDDAERLYVLGKRVATAPVELAAVLLRTDAWSSLGDADRLGALANATLTTPGMYTFVSVTIAPNEQSAAAVLERTNVRPARRSLVLVPLYSNYLASVFPLPNDSFAGRFAWSPDGSLLACYIDSQSEHQFAVVTTRGVRRAAVSYSSNALYGGPMADWSPDGRWVAYASLNGIGMVSADGALSYALSSIGGWPAWQPPQTPPGGR